MVRHTIAFTLAILGMFALTGHAKAQNAEVGKTFEDFKNAGFGVPQFGKAPDTAGGRPKRLTDEELEPLPLADPNAIIVPGWTSIKPYPCAVGHLRAGKCVPIGTFKPDYLEHGTPSFDANILKYTIDDLNKSYNQDLYGISNHDRNTIFYKYVNELNPPYVAGIAGSTYLASNVADLSAVKWE